MSVHNVHNVVPTAEDNIVITSTQHFFSSHRWFLSVQVVLMFVQVLSCVNIRRSDITKTTNYHH